MKTVKVGSIITRSDNQRYIILDKEHYNSIKIPEGINRLLSSTKSAQFLIGKKVGDSFLPGGNSYQITGIKDSNYDQIVEDLEVESDREKREFEALLDEDNFDKARQKFSDKINHSVWYKKRYNEALESFKQEIISALKEAFSGYNFKLAEKIYEKNTNILPESLYMELCDRYGEQYKSYKHKEALYKLKHALNDYDFEKAHDLYRNSYRDVVSNQEFQQLKQKSIDDYWQTDADGVLAALKENNFLLADKRLKRLEASIYLKKKAEYVKDWFAHHVYSYGDGPYIIDEEQACAISDTKDNILVAARAGSGKTRTLIAKIVLLIQKYNVHFSSILVFCFNSEAAKEINRRLKTIEVDGAPIIDSDIATTFHAFAYRIIYNICKEESIAGKILYDGDRERFINGILDEHHNHIKDTIYDFFRSEEISDEAKKSRYIELFDARMNSCYETLDGKTVRSQCEKIICDYLFEHNIDYWYETEIYPRNYERMCEEGSSRMLRSGKKVIKPDFYLPEQKQYWEHWMFGDHEEDSSDEKMQEIRKEYLEQKEWKRWFYEKSWLIRGNIRNNNMRRFLESGHLIETFREPNTSRELFEAQITRTLKQNGINARKLPKNQLIERVGNSQVSRFAKKISQFIDRAEQEYQDNLERLRHDIDTKSANERTDLFLNIAFDCYSKYLYYLKKDAFGRNPLERKREGLSRYCDYGIDFSLLLHRATEKIKQNSDSNIRDILFNKEYILIDEYQDFSNLQYELIDAIRQNNFNTNVFAVGDDWQAINRFAGSDTRFFNNFKSYYSGETQKHYIHTNYRSCKRIVDTSNSFIKFALGQDAHIKSKKEEESKQGCVRIINPEKIFIDNRSISNSDDIYRSCLALRIKKNNTASTKIFAQYLKACTEEIIQKYINKSGKLTKNILFLHRNNNLSFRINIDDFLFYLKIAASKKLGITREELNNKLKIMTMHKSKGLDEDVVVILEADDGIIPQYHQDTCLYEIFGENEEVAYNDQVRLFYVAITRAKQDLYIFHTDNEEIAKDEDDEEDNYLFTNKQKSFWKCVQDSIPGANKEDDSIFY